MKYVLGCTFAATALLSSCATYNYADNLKMVGFDDTPKKGQSLWNIRGEDCTWNVLGYKLGGDPTIDRAFINAKNQTGTLESAGIKTSSGANPNAALKYITNVSTKNDGFNAGIVGKKCIVVSGVGYL